jgi:hypothetical protein
LPRDEQLRRAKRAQRARDRKAGLVLCQLKLETQTAALLRDALGVPGFDGLLRAFIEETVVDIRRFPNLELLCWNRAGPFVTDRDAFSLYERNWRFVDTRRMEEAERLLISRLANKYGNGVLNV